MPAHLPLEVPPCYLAIPEDSSGTNFGPKPFSSDKLVSGKQRPEITKKLLNATYEYFFSFQSSLHYYKP